MDRFKNTDITNNLANTGDSGNNQIIMKNVALVGAGYWGKNLARVLGELGRLRTICDTDEAVAGPIAQRQGAGWVDDLGAVLEDSEIAAIVIATPAITHFEIASNALSAGKDVYVEKPCSHNPREGEILVAAAEKHQRIVTMGNQRRSWPAVIEAIEIARTKIGRTYFARSWYANKRPRTGKRTKVDVPKPLDWDLWQGPVAERPYCDGLHPANWRRFWDYGTGTLGDMACHLMDVVHWALDLGQPVRVMSEGPAWHPVGTPNWMRAHFVHRVPKTGGGQRDLVVHWADSGASGDYAQKGFPNGIRFVGSAGSLVCHYGNWVLEPAEKFTQFEAPARSIAPSVGHYREWLNGITEGTPTTCNFDYSGDLACTIVLGNVAYRVGEAYDGPEPYPYLKRTARKTQWRGEIEWDAATGRTGQAAADALLLREYREGWEL